MSTAIAPAVTPRQRQPRTAVVLLVLLLARMLVGCGAIDRNSTASSGSGADGG